MQMEKSKSSIYFFFHGGPRGGHVVGKGFQLSWKFDVICMKTDRVQGVHIILHKKHVYMRGPKT